VSHSSAKYHTYMTNFAKPEVPANIILLSTYHKNVCVD